MMLDATYVRRGSTKHLARRPACSLDEEREA
jgi:hypothetical protein